MAQFDTVSSVGVGARAQIDAGLRAHMNKVYGLMSVAMLVTAGFNDTQVGYFEPAKWVAKLRRLKTDQNPLIFRTNMTAGHSGESGRFGPIEEAAFTNAFLLDQAGLNPANPKTASSE